MSELDGAMMLVTHIIKQAVSDADAPADISDDEIADARLFLKSIKQLAADCYHGARSRDTWMMTALEATVEVIQTRECTILAEDIYSRPVKWKACTKCGTNLPATLTFFAASQSGKRGLSSWCKDCRCTNNRVRREKPVMTLDEPTCKLYHAGIFVHVPHGHGEATKVVGHRCLLRGCWAPCGGYPGHCKWPKTRGERL